MNTQLTPRALDVIADSGETGELPLRNAAPGSSGGGSAVADLIALLKECRTQLPLAAASWNDDEDPNVAAFHVPRVLDLLSRVNAAIGERA